jgi:hypothetical protein
MPGLRFSMRTVLLTTTVVAVVLGILSWLNFPLEHPVVQGFLGSYFIFLGLWAVVRGPAVFFQLADLTRRRNKLAENRAALSREVNERRAVHASKPKSCDSAQKPPE